MGDSLPPNVYRVAQRRFDAIPGSPWVYWVGDDIRRAHGVISTHDTYFHDQTCEVSQTSQV